jgi:hypothetical protein
MSNPAGFFRVALAVVSLSGGLLNAPAARAIDRGAQPAGAPSWMAFVVVRDGAQSEENCSGSLIGPRHVLTSAACAVDLAYVVGDKFPFTDATASSASNPWTATPAESIRVVLGRTDPDDTSGGVEREVTAVHVHPGYVNTITFASSAKAPKRTRCAHSDRHKSCLRVDGEFSAAHDVAVLELAEAVAAEPLMLGESRAPGETLWSYGYGAVAPGGKDDRLLSAGAFDEGGGCDPPVPGFCAMGRDRTRVAPGDGGGPWLQNIDGRLVQVGVTTDGADAEPVARVTDVTAERSWIAAAAGLGRESSNRVLAFGPGEAEVSDQMEALYVESFLEAAGYEVDVEWFLPDDLSGYGSIWHFASESPIVPADADRLVRFAAAGGGLYLTGERPCCELLNASVEGIVNALVGADGPIAVGGQGDAYRDRVTMPVNPGAVGGVAVQPFSLTTWTATAPGVISNVDADNVFASYGDQATAAVWDRTEVVGGGRLAVFMDLNWLQSYWWDEATAREITQNLALFLNGQ